MYVPSGCQQDRDRLFDVIEKEAKAFFGLIANEHDIRGRTEGVFLLNGLSMKPRHLGAIVAYVCDDDLHPLLTVEGHLRMISSLVKPARNAFRTKTMVPGWAQLPMGSPSVHHSFQIAQMIQTLALAPFHNRLYRELG